MKTKGKIRNSQNRLFYKENKGKNKKQSIIIQFLYKKQKEKQHNLLATTHNLINIEYQL